MWVLTMYHQLVNLDRVLLLTVDAPREGREAEDGYAVVAGESKDGPWVTLADKLTEEEALAVVQELWDAMVDGTRYLCIDNIVCTDNIVGVRGGDADA